MSRIAVFEDFSQLEAARASNGLTLGLLRPTRIIRLELTEVDNPEWTQEELKKLLQHQRQAGLFDAGDRASIRLLRKLPFSFHYIYECDIDGSKRRYKHKIADWEAGALFWRCYKSQGDNWQAPFRQKLEQQLPSRDLQFLMGTIHRFPDQWMIVSLIYPPAYSSNSFEQAELFF